MQCTGFNSTGKYSAPAQCRNEATDGPLCSKHAGIKKRKSISDQKRRDRQDTNTAQFIADSAVARQLVELGTPSATADGYGRVTLSVGDAKYLISQLAK